nr:MAG TPA: hypothetical protein [Caudoviricetes sp.]DAN52461.1 MAG TPA: hypothetical protein [Caudoviricetes sp.]
MNIAKVCACTSAAAGQSSAIAGASYQANLWQYKDISDL